MPLRSRVKKVLAENKPLLVFFALMMVFRSAVADWMLVPSGSMNPTLIEGDRILVDKAAYGWRVPFTTTRLTRGGDPQRGDIVIFPSPEDGTTLVKRVVGLPGDTIEMRDERLLINGAMVDSAAVSDTNADAELPRATSAQPHRYYTEQLAGAMHSIMLLPTRPADRSFGPMLVPDRQYLVLGDSRDNSKDSRYIGFVPRDSIVGRAFGVAYSLDAEHWYAPRRDRFFAALH
jgi:signal peptidase I